MAKREPNLKKEIKEARADIVSVEKKIDTMPDKLNKMPTRDEFPELLRKTFEFATLKAEHERMKRIIREHLKVEV